MEAKKLWRGRWRESLFLVKEDGLYQVCEDKWNDAGHHVDKLYHSRSLEEATDWAERKDEDA